MAQIALRPVPLVITDYNMPGMNGLQLTDAIKETSPDTRVVLITAYATPELEKRAREHRVDHYLPKPFPLDRLEQIVRDPVTPVASITPAAASPVVEATVLPRTLARTGPVDPLGLLAPLGLLLVAIGCELLRFAYGRARA